MHKVPKKHFQRRYTNNQHAHEKQALTLINYEIANDNIKEILFIPIAENVKCIWDFCALLVRM